MASFGKLVVSALHGSQENTLALANLNFDFSLVKVEPPSQFAGLGTALTPKRKKEAEEGAIHITARKLGALFEGELPRTPKLYEAYGTRVTEIVGDGKVQTRGTSQDGPFADHVGVDGTAIWAAATSGSGAIAAHLLACLLARVWKDSQAIAIWVELIESRKKMLEQNLGSNMSFPAAMMGAALIEVTRDQIAKWDASVRAWLQTADKARALQQQNVSLLLKNLALPVTQEAGDVYGAVFACWTKALSALEDLINGRPQSIQDGSLILGLSAWHIYPDIAVAGSEVLIEQHDGLVQKGGLVTVGLQNRPQDEGKGIYWSLPLSHLKYYGGAIVTTAKSGLGESRATIGDLELVAFGSILSAWNVRHNHLEEAAKIIIYTQHYLFQESAHWLRKMAETCQDFLVSKGPSREGKARLVSFGMRRCANFLAQPKDHPKSAFGLTDLGILLGLLGSLDAKLKLLGKWAWISDEDLSDCIACFSIRTREPLPLYVRLQDLKNYISNSSVPITLEELPSWVVSPGPQVLTQPDTLYHLPSNSDAESADFKLFRRIANDGAIAVFIPATQNQREKIPKYRLSLRATLAILDEGIAGLPTAFKNDLIPEKRLKWVHTLYEPRKSYFRSLDALRFASWVYSGLPTAYVDLKATRFCLCDAFFAKDLSQGLVIPLVSVFHCLCYFDTGGENLQRSELEDAVAVTHEDSIYVAEQCLSDPSEGAALRERHLDSSTYSSYSLTLSSSKCSLIRRLDGNIGEPGLAILVPPRMPEVRRLEHHASRLVNYCDFDGRYEDNLTGTSLHLRFTGSKIPAGSSLGRIGDMHLPTFFYETVIQVYDHGKWIADLDVMSAARTYKYGWGSARGESGAIIQRLQTIDSWEELLDEHPPHPLIVRAFQNPQARLAAAAVLAQKRIPFRVISSEDCAKYTPSPKSDSESEPSSSSDDNYDDIEPYEMGSASDRWNEQYDGRAGYYSGHSGPSDSDATAQRWPGWRFQPHLRISSGSSSNEVPQAMPKLQSRKRRLATVKTVYIC